MRVQILVWVIKNWQICLIDVDPLLCLKLSIRISSYFDKVLFFSIGNLFSAIHFISQFDLFHFFLVWHFYFMVLKFQLLYFYRIYYILEDIIYLWYIQHHLVCITKNSRDVINYNCKMPLVQKHIPVSEVLKLFLKSCLKISEMQYMYTLLLF